MNQPTTHTPRFTPQGLIPTAEQTAIQLAQNKVVLVDANAGAAKTTTLALRIGEALARGLAPPAAGNRRGAADGGAHRRAQFRGLCGLDAGPD